MPLNSHIADSKKMEDYPIDGIFDSAYFWDVDPKKVFVHQDSKFVITRIFGWCDFPGVLDKLDKLYPVEEIRREAMACSSIYDNESFDILSERYNIPKDEFIHFRSF